MIRYPGQHPADDEILLNHIGQQPKLASKIQDLLLTDQCDSPSPTSPEPKAAIL